MQYIAFNCWFCTEASFFGTFCCRNLGAIFPSWILSVVWEVLFKILQKKGIPRVKTPHHWVNQTAVCLLTTTSQKFGFIFRAPPFKQRTKLIPRKFYSNLMKRIVQYCDLFTTTSWSVSQHFLWLFQNKIFCSNTATVSAENSKCEQRHTFLPIILFHGYRGCNFTTSWPVYFTATLLQCILSVCCSTLILFFLLLQLLLLRPVFSVFYYWCHYVIWSIKNHE